MAPVRQSIYISATVAITISHEIARPAMPTASLSTGGSDDLVSRHIAFALGLDLQAELLLQRPGDDAADSVRLPADRVHQLLHRRAVRPAQRLDAYCCANAMRATGLRTTWAPEGRLGFAIGGFHRLDT